MSDMDAYYMGIALEEAELAYELGEVPVGAVVVKDGEIISKAHNMREANKLSTSHAELLAIEEACRALGGWRLSDCTLYVTLEPCPMCAGTVINSRIDRVVFGAKDLMAGCFGSVMNFNAYPFNHTCKVSFGVREEECRNILQKFFENKRKINKGE